MLSVDTRCLIGPQISPSGREDQMSSEVRCRNVQGKAVTVSYSKKVVDSNLDDDVLSRGDMLHSLFKKAFDEAPPEIHVEGLNGETLHLAPKN